MSSEHDHIVQLKKRKSNISKLYNEAIGTSMDKFSQSKLRQYRQILQRYRSFRSQSHNVGVAYVAKCISCELVKIWELTTIPHKSIKSVVSSVHRFIEGWNKISAEIRLKPEEQNKLDKLFDIRPKNLCTDDSLCNYLRKHSTSCWSEEFDFFIGQLRHPQSSTILNIQDKRKAENDKKKAERAAMSHTYFLNNSFNSEETSSSQGSKRYDIFSRFCSSSH